MVKYLTPQEALSFIAPLREGLDVSVAGGDWSDPTGFGPRAISVNVSGDVKLELYDDSASHSPYLQAGVLYAMNVAKIYQTGTTATGIVVWK